MQHEWIINGDDVQRVRSFVEAWSDDPFVRARIERNLGDTKPPVTREMFWSGVYACLLTTQQRSGPTSPVTKFLLLKPSPLRLSACEGQHDLPSYATRVLSSFGGLRRTTIIGKELQANLPMLQGEGWQDVSQHLEAVRTRQTVEAERKAANFIETEFRGFGPKQSRNLLQYLGLSRYEIPLDSRVTKWLRAFGFPIGLSAAVLSDRDYYEFVLDAVQALCCKAEVFPCLLDAAIFTSFDKGGWTEEGIVW
jgi:hypothetical protein